MAKAIRFRLLCVLALCGIIAAAIDVNKIMVFAQTEPDISDTIPPSTPSGLSMNSRTAYSVSIAWGAANDSGGSGLAGYEIYRGGVLLASSSTPSFKDVGLSERTAYAYHVNAYDNDDNTSPLSTTITVTTPVKGDLNADGKVNLSDLSRVAGSFGSTGADLIGDTDGGGAVNLTDLSIVAGKFGYTYTLP